VAGAGQLNSPHALMPPGGNLVRRVCSAVVLVPLAIVMAYLGGWPFAVFWGTAAIIIFWEWSSLMIEGDRQSMVMTGGASLALALALVHIGQFMAMLIVLATGALGVAALAPAGRRIWLATGLPYAGALGAAPIVLRSDGDNGFLAMIFLFAVVWGTDTVAFFVGRAIGGPKLMPAVSPNKTWSGALAGTVAAAVAALLVAKSVALTGIFAILVLAVILSLFAQGGDLFESFVKRRFGAKDSGRLIPGHGGLMDRLDGFVAAGFVAALVGVLRGGFESPARGLLEW
jgi:phosphatidate cytidylyltransferase